MLRTTLFHYSVKPAVSQALGSFFQRVGVRAESVRRCACVALSVAGVGGEISERQLQDLTGYAQSTVRLACRRLTGLKILTPIPKPLGRGYLKAYRVVWGMSEGSFSSNRRNLKKSPDKTIKTYKQKQSKDTPAGASQGVQSVRVGESQGKGRDRGQLPAQAPSPKRSLLDYHRSEAAQVTLILGARFYRYVMRAIRLGLEEWALHENIRDALEGFYGNRIDGASLAYARELRDRIWALRSEIERLAASGASPRRVCSFVAGRLAGVPEKRSRREVLQRTAELLKSDPIFLERRIAGLKRWLAERESEYYAGQVCARCGYRHSTNEHRSGYRDDGSGSLSCFGFARVKMEELKQLLKSRHREQVCRHCGGSLKGGNINGVCWSCYDQGRSRATSGPAMISDILAGALKNIGLNGPELPSASNSVSSQPTGGLCKFCQAAPATGYGYCDECRRLLVRQRGVTSSWGSK